MNFEQSIRKQAEEFFAKMNAELKNAGLVLEEGWLVDHLCYRTLSLEAYAAVLKDFAKFSTLLIESQVHGRAIATFKLAMPLPFGKRTVDVIEVTAPKPGKKTIEGFEHFEIVCDLPFEELQHRFQHLNMDSSGLRKKLNPELEICFGERNIKFHHLSLEQVIRLEKVE
jgi:predicted metalloenzyme YecM